MGKSRRERDASRAGYTIDEEGVARNPEGEEMPMYPNLSGCLAFRPKLAGKTERVYVHRMQAYQRFGDELYGRNVLVIHIDGDRRNNRPDNVRLGKPSDNYYREERMRRLR